MNIFFYIWRIFLIICARWVCNLYADSAEMVYDQYSTDGTYDVDNNHLFYANRCYVVIFQ